MTPDEAKRLTSKIFDVASCIGLTRQLIKVKPAAWERAAERQLNIAGEALEAVAMALGKEIE